MHTLKSSFFLEQKQPWSFDIVAPPMSSHSVLGPLRKREYQTKQQQIRRGTTRQIGYPSQTHEQFPLSEPLGQVNDLNDPKVNSSSSSDSSATNVMAASFRGSESRNLPTSSSYPAVHPLSMSVSPSAFTHGSETRQGDAAMDWNPSPIAHPPTSHSPRINDKNLMQVDQAMGFGASSSLPQSSMRPGTLRNPHLSVAEMGGTGRRMSTPTISTSSRPSSQCPSSLSPSSTPMPSSHPYATSAPHPGLALSGSRTWTTSRATEAAPSSGPLSTTSSHPVSNEPHRYHSINQGAGYTSPLVTHREGCGHQQKLKPTPDLVSARIPSLISESEFTFEGYDKTFATTWASYEEVLLGTKCNKIVLLNTRTNKRMEIYRMEECLLESAQIANSRLAELAAKGENIFRTPSTLTNVTPRSPQEAYYDYEGNVIQGLTSALERNLRLFNAGRRSSTPSYLSTPTSTRVPFTNFGNGSSTVGWSSGSSGSSNSNYAANGGGTQNQAAPWQNSATVGIRSLSINPSRTLLAVGSGDLLQVTIYKVPEFEPIGVMYGHTDLVFSLTWVSDTVLVTGSKDGSMRVWSMDSPILTTLPSVARPIEVRQPVITRADKTSKVRYLTLNKGTGQLMTLTTEGYVKLWDRGSFSEVSKIKLIHTSETVCASANAEANVFAVGSQSHISIIDPRTSSIVRTIDSCDEGWGVRSLDFKSNILTTGGGYGRIGFYDLRAQRYLDGFGTESTKKYLEIGHGWLNYDTAFSMNISGVSIRNAIYAMEYDSTGTRLFTAGGPLQLGLCGAYAALWS
ncbi:MAG: hypothetical protein J3Q66DRAFT_344152 [Benniella sp.]|nr:MAG: hypothetical protein J3Q66DRAFT_344152 [Benniella sp.]